MIPKKKILSHTNSYDISGFPSSVSVVWHCHLVNVSHCFEGTWWLWNTRNPSQTDTLSYRWTPESSYKFLLFECYNDTTFIHYISKLWPIFVIFFSIIQVFYKFIVFSMLLHKGKDMKLLMCVPWNVMEEWWYILHSF